MNVVKQPMKPWNRIPFFIYLGDLMAGQSPPIRDLQALGDFVGINASTFSKWKNERTRPTIETLHLIADRLGVSRDEVVSRAGILDAPPPRVDSTDEDATVSRIRASRLSPAQKDQLIATHLAEKAAAAQDLDRRMRVTIDLLEGAAKHASDQHV